MEHPMDVVKRPIFTLLYAKVTNIKVINFNPYIIMFKDFKIRF
jgi:hypothetical protein